MVFRTRPPVKQEAIRNTLRMQIVRGELKPGDRLPSRSELEAHFAASSVTVQRAFDQLLEDGFVVARGRLGTFVTQRPPHLHNFGLVFGQWSGGHTWGRFHAALAEAAQRIESRGDVKVSIYTGVSEEFDTDSSHRLAEDLQCMRMAGLIFVGRAIAPMLLKHAKTPKHFPVVALMSPPLVEGLPAVDLGSADGFIVRATDYLIQHGRRKIALISVSGMEEERLRAFDVALRRAGIELRPQWIHGVDPHEARWAANLTQLLLQAGGGERPDGLIVADDNLVEHACAGLMAANVRIPEDLDVVAHCNFPDPYRPLFPLARLGFNTDQVLDTCIRILQEKRDGAIPPAHTILRPEFEWELPVQTQRPKKPRR